MLELDIEFYRWLFKDIIAEITSALWSGQTDYLTVKKCHNLQ